MLFPSFADRCRPDFAPLLKASFDIDEIERQDGTIFGLWPGFELAYFNPAWLRFAAENGGEPAISERWPVGASIMDAMPLDLVLFFRDLFLTALADDRNRRHPVRHQYECSSAELFRLFVMTLYPVGHSDGLLVVNTTLETRPHDPAERPPRKPDRSLYRGDDGAIRQCAHCRRTRNPRAANRWDWVPEWVAASPPETSHTLCNVCLDYYYPPSK